MNTARTVREDLSCQFQSTSRIGTSCTNERRAFRNAKKYKDMYDGEVLHVEEAQEMEVVLDSI
jgi:hypothetical protein